jgi:hypothetical protein
VRRTVIFILIALAATACTRATSDESAGGETPIPAPSDTVATSTTTTTAPSSTTSTTRPPATSSTTTTTNATSTTRAPAATTTTIAIPEDNLPPTVEILAPAALSAHIAGYDADRRDFGAYVTLSARASDPNGDTVQVRWSAPGWGSFGTGTSIVAWISTRGSDASQPNITATAIDQWGVETSASVQIIVWIPSDA